MSIVMNQWYIQNESIQESTTLAKSAKEKSNGVGSGIVTKETIHVVNCILQKDGVTRPDPPSHANGTLSLPFLGRNSTTITINAEPVWYYTVNPWPAEPTRVSGTASWHVEGGKATFSGYADQIIPVTIWTCTLVSYGRDWKKGTWVGKMNPDVFDQMTSTTTTTTST